MSESTVGKWGKNLAVRIPATVARAAGLSDGERVEVEIQDGDILIRRRAAQAKGRRDAEAAVAEIIAASRQRPLSKGALRKLLEEGRRG